MSTNCKPWLYALGRATKLKEPGISEPGNVSWRKKKNNNFTHTRFTITLLLNCSYFFSVHSKHYSYKCLLVRERNFIPGATSCITCSSFTFYITEFADVTDTLIKQGCKPHSPFPMATKNLNSICPGQLHFYEASSKNIAVCLASNLFTFQEKKEK